MKGINNLRIIMLYFISFTIIGCSLQNEECTYTTDLVATGSNAVKISSISPLPGNAINYGDSIKIELDFSLSDPSVQHLLQFSLYLINGDEKIHVSDLSEGAQGGSDGCYSKSNNLGHVTYHIEFKPNSSIESPYTFQIDMETYSDITGAITETLTSSDTWILN